MVRPLLILSEFSVNFESDYSRSLCIGGEFFLFCLREFVVSDFSMICLNLCIFYDHLRLFVMEQLAYIDKKKIKLGIRRDLFMQFSWRIDQCNLRFI